jgi:DNA-binding LytR/AlgR family response regulator
VNGGRLSALVVDDEPPAREYLHRLLLAHDAIDVECADDATSALRHLRDRHVDAVFLDVRMPGLDGMELAQVIARFERRPAIVFVTAYDTHAVDAFGVHAVDYLLKPVEPNRLDEALARIRSTTSHDRADPTESTVPPPPGDPYRQVAAERGGRTVMVDRARVHYVEASRDYCRLHTADGAFLVRVPISTLEAAWAERGWLRIHRSYLVCAAQVRELRRDSELGWLARVGATELPVSRRNLPALRDRMLRSSRALRTQQPVP